jgi:hypothetical protein
MSEWERFCKKHGYVNCECSQENGISLEEFNKLQARIKELIADLHREKQLRPGAWDEHYMKKEIKDLESRNTRLVAALEEAEEMIVSEYCSHNEPCGNIKGCYAAFIYEALEDNGAK